MAAGLAKAGHIVGTSLNLFRPVSANNPTGGLPLGTIDGLFDPAPSLMLTSPDYRRDNQALFVGDPSYLQAGDYLVGPETWFVSHVEPLRPAACTLCNRIISIGMPAAATVAGVNAYGGNTAVGVSAIATLWPASVLARTHVDIDPTRLPSDIKSSFFEVLMPAIPGVNLTFGLTLQDDLGQNYTISSAELSLTGWKLLAGIQTT